jgi:hypothetical protein
MYSIVWVSGQLGLIYCNPRPGNSQDQPAFSLFPRDTRESKVRNSAGMGKADGCSFAAFNNEISERGPELHIRVEQPFSDSANICR